MTYLFELLRRQIVAAKKECRGPAPYTRLVMNQERINELKRNCYHTEADTPPSFAGVRVVVDPDCVRPYFETSDGRREYI